jgi:peptidoglycan/LPS O-acetylase OafA/YrhL
VTRNHNLDLFRFTAITFVVIYHVIQMFSIVPEPYGMFYKIGQFGVELFFVLSGFLIAGLYYKKRPGEHNLFHFWLKRFVRTFPPYIIALLLSYLLVYYSRHEKFDPGYLIFAQNFKLTIPYFLVSWSLCIEEHFYVAFPFVVLLMDRVIKSQKVNLAIWIALCFVPLFFRLFLGNPFAEEFGYYKTATIFKFEGIAVGCLLAFIVYRLKIKPKSFPLLLLVPLTLVFALSMVLFQNQFIYVAGYLVLTLSIGLVLARFYYLPSFAIARFSFINRTALMAYSLYLVHPLIIHGSMFLSGKMGLNNYSGAVLSLVAIYLTGLVFYKMIEFPAIQLRNRIIKT